MIDKSRDCKKKAIRKVKEIITENDENIMYRSKLVKSLATELEIEENNASKIVDTLEEDKLITYTGGLQQIDSKISARELVITERGEQIIQAGESPSLY